MKTKTAKTLSLVTALAWGLVYTPVQAQRVPITAAAEVPGPARGTAMTMAYVQTVGRMAYLWGWPLVNGANRSAVFAKVPELGLLGAKSPRTLTLDLFATVVPGFGRYKQSKASALLIWLSQNMLDGRRARKKIKERSLTLLPLDTRYLTG